MLQSGNMLRSHIANHSETGPKKQSVRPLRFQEARPFDFLLGAVNESYVGPFDEIFGGLRDLRYLLSLPDGHPFHQRKTIIGKSSEIAGHTVALYKNGLARLNRMDRKAEIPKTACCQYPPVRLDRTDFTRRRRTVDLDVRRIQGRQFGNPKQHATVSDQAPLSLQTEMQKLLPRRTKTDGRAHAPDRMTVMES